MPRAQREKVSETSEPFRVYETRRRSSRTEAPSTPQTTARRRRSNKTSNPARENSSENANSHVEVPAPPAVPTPAPTVVEESSCTICLGSSSTKGELPCAHSFCYKCIKTSAHQLDSRCPLCRAEFREITRIDSHGRQRKIPVRERVQRVHYDNMFSPNDEDGLLAIQRLLLMNALFQHAHMNPFFPLGVQIMRTMDEDDHHMHFELMFMMRDSGFM